LLPRRGRKYQKAIMHGTKKILLGDAPVDMKME
jgi:hypothetical protein